MVKVKLVESLTSFVYVFNRLQQILGGCVQTVPVNPERNVVVIFNHGVRIASKHSEPVDEGLNNENDLCDVTFNGIRPVLTELRFINVLAHQE